MDIQISSNFERLLFEAHGRDGAKVRSAMQGLKQSSALTIEDGALTFEPIRTEVFGAFCAGVAAGRAGGTAPAVFNAANEEAVAAFLAGRITFGQISGLIESALDAHQVRPAVDMDTVRAADCWARRRVRESVG